MYVLGMFVPIRMLSHQQHAPREVKIYQEVVFPLLFLPSYTDQ